MLRTFSVSDKTNKYSNYEIHPVAAKPLHSFSKELRADVVQPKIEETAVEFQQISSKLILFLKMKIFFF